MATLKEFEDVLRERGMQTALAILDELKKRDRAKRSIAPARRVVGRKMTVELARAILDLHATSAMTQQEIAFKLGVNQGRVNEVIKRGKWLSGDPAATEMVSRDKAMQRLDGRVRARRADAKPARPSVSVSAAVAALPLLGVMPRSALSAKVPSKGVTLSRPAQDAPVRQASLLPTPEPRIISAQLAFLDL